jgi:tetratricopeptide (TPR) repeat protein
MTIRKTVGWLVFATLVVVIILQVPGIAASACYRAGSKFYAAGKYNSAVSAFSGAVFLKPGFARGYIELGSSYLALEKYAQAEQAFLAAKGIEDESCAACGLGMTYHGLNRNDAAEKEFRRAMSLNPSDFCAHNQLAKMYYNIGRYHEAIAGFKRVLTIRPRSGTYVYIGNSHVYAREYEAGVDAYKQAIQLDSKNGRAYLQLGVAYDYLQRNGEAAAAYKEAVKLDPKDESARYSLALAYMSLHNKPAALEQYEALRKLNPDDAADLFERLRLSEQRARGKEKLYFVPLSNYSAASLTKLVNFCKEKIGVQAILIQPLPFALSTVNKRRQQVIAEEAIELIKVKYPNLAADPNAVIIGLTDEDMYIRKQTWEYAFSYQTQGRFAVVSSARMNPANLGGSANDVLTDSRVRKMVMKNIGVLYYLYPTNYDPNSVLYEGVGGVEDLDKMGEDF